MAISAELQTLAKAKIARHLRQCPVCQSTNFTFNEDLSFLPRLSATFVDIGTGQPCVSVSCVTCGHVLLFNLFQMGLADAFGLKPGDQVTPVKGSGGVSGG